MTRCTAGEQDFSQARAGSAHAEEIVHCGKMLNEVIVAEILAFTIRKGHRKPRKRTDNPDAGALLKTGAAARLRHCAIPPGVARHHYARPAPAMRRGLAWWKARKIVASPASGPAAILLDSGGNIVARANVPRLAGEHRRSCRQSRQCACWIKPDLSLALEQKYARRLEIPAGPILVWLTMQIPPTARWIRIV